MGVKADTARRLRSSIFLVVLGLTCGSLMGFAITPHTPTDAANSGGDGGGGGGGGGESHSFMSNLHMPSFSSHPNDDRHDEEGHHDAAADDHSHDEDANHPAISAVPEHSASSSSLSATGMTSQTHKQSGKQSWANPEHRQGGVWSPSQRSRSTPIPISIPVSNFHFPFPFPFPCVLFCSLL